MMVRIPAERLPPALRSDARFAEVVIPATALATPLQRAAYLRAFAEQLVLDAAMSETELAALDAANAWAEWRPYWTRTEHDR